MFGTRSPHIVSQTLMLKHKYHLELTFISTTHSNEWATNWAFIHSCEGNDVDMGRGRSIKDTFSPVFAIRFNTVLLFSENQYVSIAMWPFENASLRLRAKETGISYTCYSMKAWLLSVKNRSNDSLY